MRDEAKTKRELIEELQALRRQRAEADARASRPAASPGGSPCEPEALFRNLVENVNDVLYRMDRDGVILYISPVVEPIVGYRVEDLVGRPFWDFIFPEDLETAERQFRKAQGGEVAVGEFRVTHRTGRPIWAKSSSRPMVEGGRIVGIQGIITDISERKRMEEALRESEERFRTLFLQAPIGIFIYDRGLVVTDCNEQFARIVRSNRDRIIGLDLTRLREEAVLPHLFAALDNRTSHYEGRYRALTTDDAIWVSFNISPLHDAERRVIGGIGAVEEITDRVKMQAALRVSEARYRQMVEKANDIILRCDRRGCFTFVNPVTERITGYAASELLGRSYLDFIPPDHREQVTATFAEQFAARTRNTYSELPIVAKDGRTIWFGQNSQLIMDGDRIEGWQVVSRDISDRKRMEEELRRLSISDPLTGLYNRRGFMTLAEQQLKLAVRARQGFLLYFADMDNLKGVNDRFGHQEGDRAIVETAAILKEVFRASDIVARIGGDEFAVLAVSGHLRDAEILKRRLMRRIEAVNAEGRNRFEISLSVGVALFNPADPRTLADLMSEADGFMYEDKKARR